MQNRVTEFNKRLDSYTENTSQNYILIISRYITNFLLEKLPHIEHINYKSYNAHRNNGIMYADIIA